MVMSLFAVNGDEIVVRKPKQLYKSQDNFQAFAKPIQLNFFRNSILAFGESRWKATNVAFQAGIPTKPLPTIEILQEMHFAVVANIYMGKTEHNTFECWHTYM